MRILNLIPLALILSIILAGCVTQLPQKPAFIIGAPDTADLTHDGVVEEVFDIPGLDLGRGPGACRVVVKLRGVYYGGDNIGSTWNFSGKVNNRSWFSKLQKMRHGRWNPMDLSIFENINRHGCHTNLLFFNVTARQLDTFQDFGTNSTVTGIPCPERMTRRQVFIPVSVLENPGGIGFKEARLDFLFEITSVCLTP